MDLREVGYDDRDWINLAQNRYRWRAYFGGILQVMDSAARLYYYKDNLQDAVQLYNSRRMAQEEYSKKLNEELQKMKLDIDEGGNADYVPTDMDENKPLGGTSSTEDVFGTLEEGDTNKENDGVSDDNGGSDSGANSDGAEGGSGEEAGESDSENIGREYQKGDYFEPDFENDQYLHLADSRETLITRVLLGLIHVAVNVSLLYGAWTEKPTFMLPYILIQFVFVVIVLLLVIIGFIALLFISMFTAFVLLIIGGPFAVLFAYLWAAVYTYYRTLTEDMLPPKDTQLQQLQYTKSEEEEAILNPEEIQKAYSQIEYNIQQNQPHAV
ncbi:hypothetical protein ANN_02839 [Periplaneta americana]|uniref:Uncharacterized protein n=1 Tax=Periplaneta americana TaxID=6978 RepID=A0ABQ8TXD7_PERAM|nr:hypothetical protein ANN_02839 [Periplaneta americana]